jgi:peptidoglycan biosynthesis protein MviN/MurJ (putative lipid II flippase)
MKTIFSIMLLVLFGFFTIFARPMVHGCLDDDKFDPNDDQQFRLILILWAMLFMQWSKPKRDHQFYGWTDG